MMSIIVTHLNLNNINHNSYSTNVPLVWQKELMLENWSKAIFAFNSYKQDELQLLRNQPVRHLRKNFRFLSA